MLSYVQPRIIHIPSHTKSSNGLDDYPKPWDNLSSHQQGTVFYDSPEECCQKYWKGPCEHTNYCVGSSGGDNEPVTTTSTTSTTSIPSDCAEAHDYWHPTTDEGPKTCSNGKFDYPSGWDQLPLSQQGTVFFNTAEECCQEYWKEDCVQTNICAGGGGNELQPTAKPVNNEPTSGGESTEPKPTNFPIQGSEPVTTTTTSTSASSQQTNCDAHEFWHPVTDPGPKSCSNALNDYPKGE